MVQQLSKGTQNVSPPPPFSGAFRVTVSIAPTIWCSQSAGTFISRILHTGYRFGKTTPPLPCAVSEACIASGEKRLSPRELRRAWPLIRNFWRMVYDTTVVVVCVVFIPLLWALMYPGKHKPCLGNKQKRRIRCLLGDSLPCCFLSVSQHSCGIAPRAVCIVMFGRRCGTNELVEHATLLRESP